MKKLVCEMCGGTNIVKENGVYVCQNCGVQYSLEEAKKMMIEGTVNVQGTVQVDNTTLVENYYRNARRAMQQEDWEGVERYYDLILQNNPGSIEAIFYSAYGRVKLSFYESDVPKRAQKINVLINNIYLIGKSYNPNAKEDCRDVIEMISNDVMEMADSSYVYNIRRNDYGMQVASDKADTAKLLVALQKAFVETMESILKTDPQLYICEIIIKHCEALIKNDRKNESEYRRKIDAVRNWIKRDSLNEYFKNNPTESAHYKELMDSVGESRKKYIEKAENLKHIQKNKPTKKQLETAVREYNELVRDVREKQAAVEQYIKSLNLSADKLFEPISEIDVKNLEEYRSVTRNILGIISFIMGILSLIMAFAFIFTLGTGLIINIPALIMAFIALFQKGKRKGVAVGALIINLMAIVISAIWIGSILFLYENRELLDGISMLWQQINILV